jgi:polyhydroxybutyrate depolymerase
MSGRDFDHRLEIDGRPRWCAVRLPSVYDGQTPMPLVLALHGATSNPRLMEKFSGLTEKAESAGFLVGYPAGSGVLPNVLTWNGGGCCGFAQKNAIDDVGFLGRLIDDLSESLRIDPQRVYLAGMSNGAHMAYRAAAAMSERIAAIACVAGPLSIELGRPARGMPVLHIHGTDDEFAPLAGGAGPRSVFGAALPSIPETIAAWVRADDCPETPTTTTIPDRVGDGTRIVRSAYGPGRDGSEVVLYVVEGGGHTWPGRPPLPLSLGKSTGNMDANDVIWEFFQRHGRDVQG